MVRNAISGALFDQDGYVLDEIVQIYRNMLAMLDCRHDLAPSNPRRTSLGLLFVAMTKGRLITRRVLRRRDCKLPPLQWSTFTPPRTQIAC